MGNKTDSDIDSENENEEEGDSQGPHDELNIDRDPVPPRVVRPPQGEPEPELEPEDVGRCAEQGELIK